MPQTGDRRGRVLHWDEVYGQFTQAAASMPIEEVNRDLAAMGYDLDRLNRAPGRLVRRTCAGAAGGTSVARREERARATLPPLPQPAPHALRNAGGASRHYGAWRRGTRSAVAGVVAVALLAWLAVPISETSLGRLPTAAVASSDKQAHVRIAEADPAGHVRERDANSGSPHIDTPPSAKVATSKKCGAANGACGKAKALAAGGKVSSDKKHIAADGEGKRAPAKTMGAETRQQFAMVCGQQPSSAG